ncbi:MAG: hypothetical protein QW356_07325 [Candidatus Hadarchaeales archaeon]
MPVGINWVYERFGRNGVHSAPGIRDLRFCFNITGFVRSYAIKLIITVSFGRIEIPQQSSCSVVQVFCRDDAELNISGLLPGNCHSIIPFPLLHAHFELVISFA